jgi:hypothetical protein
MRYRIITILFLILKLSVLYAQQHENQNKGILEFKKASNVEHMVVRYEKGEFAAWPANNGIWNWKKGKEILVGYTAGAYVIQSGHKVTNPKNALARSKDGGKTWESFSPEIIADEDIAPSELTSRINFKHPNFALRVRGVGYHGNSISAPCFYYSYDKGETWRGPFAFKGLDDMHQVQGMKMTPRTDYQVTGKNECLIFFSGTTDAWLDKTFVLHTSDGGLNFSFKSWIVPPTDPYRAVMPQTIALDKNTLLSVQRRRHIPPSNLPCWIDAFISTNGGESWSLLSRVANTGEGSSNGSPPAITKLNNGNLCVVYGNRSLRMLLCRLSEDNGKTWGDEIIIRDDFNFDGKGFADFGYPRVIQRKDGKIVAIYYFATEERPEQHIAGTIFSLDDLQYIALKEKNIIN